MPDLAIGCLMKPFTAEDVHRSLAMAEDLLRGREALRPKMPDNLTLYEPHEPESVPEPGLFRRSGRCGRGSSTGSQATITKLGPHHPLSRLTHAHGRLGQAERRRRAAPGAGP